MTLTHIAPPSPAASPKRTKGEKIEVACWRKNSAEHIKVVLDLDTGHPTVALHLYWFDEADREIRGRGLTLSAKHLDALARAFSKARDIAAERGLLDVEERA